MRPCEEKKDGCKEFLTLPRGVGIHLKVYYTQGRILGGALGARAPRGHKKGAPKEKEKRKRKEREGKKRKRREKERKKGRKREEERKKKERKLNQYDERGVMQFKVQAGAPGKKTSGAPNWRRKGREGSHAVSSASRDSREENVRGAKLTEKRTRDAPWSFKCKQGLQGRKRQGRQIDGEKDERVAMQFQVQTGAPEKKTSGAPNWRRKGRGAPCSFEFKLWLQGKKCQGRQIDGEKDGRGVMQFQVQAGTLGKEKSGAPNWRRKRQDRRHAVSSASKGSREENVRGAKLTEKRARRAPCSFKFRQGLQGRKSQGRQINGEKGETGAMQFQVQAAAPGKKTSGAPNWRRKGWEGRHSVSSASRGPRDENVRGAKLTEKRTRGAPCSFKCKQGLQGRKRQGR